MVLVHWAFRQHAATELGVLVIDVLDEWSEEVVRPRLTGEAFVIRYADDFVIGAAREDDAKRIMDVLPKRITGITGSLETSTASWNSGREREVSGDASCLGDAETVK